MLQQSCVPTSLTSPAPLSKVGKTHEMSEKRLPPHLQIAESVTEEEYKSALWQSKVVLTVALLTGMILSLPMIYVLGLFYGLTVAGFCTV